MSILQPITNAVAAMADSKTALEKQVKQLTTQLAAAKANAADPAEVKAITDNLGAIKAALDTLSAAVAAAFGTP